MSQQLLEAAIRNKSVIEFSYSNHHRIVEPHVLGVNGDTLQFLGYQIGGTSNSGGIPEWRRFDLNRMSNLVITNQSFPGPRPFPSGRHSTWDRQILVVVA